MRCPAAAPFLGDGALRRCSHLPHAAVCVSGPIPPTEIGQFVQVLVRDNNVDQALRVLKKKMQREGVFKEMKMRRSYEKPSEKRVREKAEAVRRARKLARKKAQREGLLPAPKRKERPARPRAAVIPTAMAE